jgi:hypothetical protein
VSHDPEKTGTYQSGAEAASPGSAAEGSETLPDIPGYAIEGVLGRGGMGVVYKARYLALKRTVALKMILGSGHAGAQERLRFKAEAEAVARLQHPHIVQVFEVGEHQGLPFCALEFVDGGSLDKKLKDQPLPPRQAAQLVATLADAMHLTHSRNVVHRDLKPANVLLTADGVPKVTDFGLARQLDSDSERTHAGAVMGTPSYMAPEQASGQTHEAGPAADTYALGAILYACLTGRPPFQSANVVETLDQVRQQEPVAPRLLQPKVPRDLETVCLKCLRKQPEQRYASARELGEDLGRFLRGEPVTARPVGPMERAWRWCRRNPVVAGLATAVTVVLIVATIVSMSFRAAAEDRAEQLGIKNVALEEATAELTTQRDNLVTVAAEGMTHALAENPGPLTDREIEALWKPAESPKVPLGVRFVEVSLGNPVKNRQLRNRVEWALQAAVGLDLNKRVQVERSLVQDLQSRSTPEQQGEIALTLAQVGIQDSALAGKAAATLNQAMSKTTEPWALWGLARGLSAVAAHLERKDAAEAAAALSQAMSRTTDPPNAVRELAQGLSAVAACLEPKEAAAVLSQAMSKTTDRDALFLLARGLPAMAAHLKPKAAGEVAATISLAMSKTADPQALEFLAQGLSAVAARLEPKEASEAAATLSQAMSKTRDGGALYQLAQVLSEVAARMEPKEAAVVCGQAAATLTQAMAKTTDPYALQGLAQGLSAVAARMEPKEAAAVCGRTAATLTQVITKNPYAPQLAQGLSAVATRLEPKDAGEGAATLTQAMSKTTDPAVLQRLVQRLSAVAARMEPKEAAVVCGQVAATLSQAMSKTRDGGALYQLAQVLSEVAARMEPKEAAVVCGQAAIILSQVMSKMTNEYHLNQLAQGLSAVAARMEPKEAAATLTQAMAKTTDGGALYYLAQGCRRWPPGWNRRRLARCVAGLPPPSARP